MNAEVAGRPDIMGGRTSLTLYEGMEGMMENTFINIKNKSFTITADINISKKATQGVILAQGGRFGGWALYMRDGKPEFMYNFLGLDRYVVASTKELPKGASTVKFDFVYVRKVGRQTRHPPTVGRSLPIQDNTDYEFVDDVGVRN